jgi:hypothetical protein
MTPEQPPYPGGVFLSNIYSLNPAGRPFAHDVTLSLHYATSSEVCNVRMCRFEESDSPRWVPTGTDVQFDPQSECVSFQTSTLGIFAVIGDSYVPFDFNRDCDVDADDFRLFEACLTGPAIPYNPGSLPEPSPGCTLTPDGNGIIAADADENGEVDQTDFNAFQRCFSGQGQAPVPDCAD